MRLFITRAKIFSLILIPLFLLSCASTYLPPIGAGGKTFKPEDDEKRLWEAVVKEEVKLDASDKILHDPLLEDYVNDIAFGLIPPEVKAQPRVAFRVKVIKDPTLNAFAYPNGRIYVHSGLIARSENEAQLATVLGHEMGHVTYRHAIRGYRDQRNKAIGLTVAAILASIGLAVLGARAAKEGHPEAGAAIYQTGQVLLSLGLKFGYAASVNGYGRDLEREADLVGMRYLLDAGYDPKESPKVFQLMLKTYGDRPALEQFFFGSHPNNSERIANYRELLRGKYAEAVARPDLVKNTERFRMRTRVLVRENAYLDIQAGRYNQGREGLEKALSIMPNDAKAYYYYGELYRLSAKSVLERQQAISKYRRALELDPDLSLAYRSIGLTYYRLGMREEARVALKNYLEIKPRKDEDPEAYKLYLKEKKQIEEYIRELERS